MEQQQALCPWRIHGEKTKSWTVEGEYTYNEYFMPCIGNKCPCYFLEYTPDGYQAICKKDGANFILGTLDKEEFGPIIKED